MLADSGYVTRILEETRKVWNKMKNVTDKSVPMTDDGEMTSHPLILHILHVPCIYSNYY